MNTDPTKPRLLAVIVLYKQTSLQSLAFVTLRTLLTTHPEIRLDISCLVFDNSPEPNTPPVVSFPCAYLHDATNPGLARAYQTALAQAVADSIPWLLLLDQDTELTAAFLHEISACLSNDEVGLSHIAALVPKLLQDGDVLSPHWPSFHRNRGSFLPLHGRINREVAVFNSGAVLRTDALEGIGGFPNAFPLDFLDHAVFRQLQRNAWCLWLLHATLPHHLASKNGDFEAQVRHSPRLHSIVRAQSRFYLRYGTSRERLFHLIRRARMVGRLALKGHLREALLLARYTLRPL